jgi:hypothetical protein
LSASRNPRRKEALDIRTRNPVRRNGDELPRLLKS